MLLKMDSQAQKKKRKSLPLQFSGSDTEDLDRDAPSHCLAGSVAKQGLVKEYADPLYTGYEPSKSKGVQTTPIQSVPVGYKSYDEWYHSPFLMHPVCNVSEFVEDCITTCHVAWLGCTIVYRHGKSPRRSLDAF